MKKKYNGAYFSVFFQILPQERSETHCWSLIYIQMIFLHLSIFFSLLGSTYCFSELQLMIIENVENSATFWNYNWVYQLTTKYCVPKKITYISKFLCVRASQRFFCYFGKSSHRKDFPCRKFWKIIKVWGKKV